jgi:hypothetical protein
MEDGHISQYRGNAEVPVHVDGDICQAVRRGETYNIDAPAAELQQSDLRRYRSMGWL